MNCKLPRGGSRRNPQAARRMPAGCTARSPASEGTEEPPPTHDTRMNNGIRIGKKSFANLTGLPSIGIDIEGHVDQDGSADDVAARNAAPKAAVQRIAAVRSEEHTSELQSPVH